MCETSLITVTDTQMQYLATNVTQNLGFHHPPDDRDAFEGVYLYKRRGVLCISWEKWLFFFIFWREIYEKSARYPLSFPWSEGRQRTKKCQKIIKRGYKIGIFWHFGGGFQQRGLGSVFFFWYYDLSEALEQSLEWKKRVLKFLWKYPFFLTNLSKKLTVCCKWLWNPSKWCLKVTKCQFFIPKYILNHQEL